jgi:hypothetical protein
VQKQLEKKTTNFARRLHEVWKQHGKKRMTSFVCHLHAMWR